MKTREMKSASPTEKPALPTVCQWGPGVLVVVGVLVTVGVFEGVKVEEAVGVAVAVQGVLLAFAHWVGVEVAVEVLAGTGVGVLG